MVFVLCVIFFFKQRTAYEMRISDWSSDVCSSDLHSPTTDRRSDSRHAPPRPELPARAAAAAILRLLAYRAPRPVVSRRVSPRSPPTRMRLPAGRVRFSRSEERSVGEEGVR